jgi:ATP/maltotriose-dependent transcriptional regulator MalT
MARAADWLGALAGSDGQLERFIKLSQQSLNWRRAINDQFGMAASLMNLGQGAVESGQYEQAKRYLEEMGQIYVAMSSEGWLVRVTGFLSWIAFQQGDFQETRAQADETLKIATNYGGLIVDGTSIAFAMLAMLAALEEDYVRSWELCQRAMYDLRPANTTPEEALAVAACGLEDYATARHYFRAALKEAVSCNDYRGMTIALPVAAILLTQEGHQERAIEVLGLAFHHPASARIWMEQWPLLTRFRAQLEAELGAAAYANAWERGKTSELGTVATWMLTHFQQDEPLQASRHGLIEPLTERELEVLRLIAAGMTNRQIGERLFLAVGTVKFYASQIYGKLHVENRVQALTRARELNLLS